MVDEVITWTCPTCKKVLKSMYPTQLEYDLPKGYEKGSPLDEHRLYKALVKFVADWINTENKSRTPYQSEIIGALDMVKMDYYLHFSAEQVMKKAMKENMVKILTALKGKTLRMSNDGAISITEVKE
jgi:hypothetical protein